jgi:hypothetical protein
MFGYLEQKLLGRSQKRWIFSNLIFSAVRNFKFHKGPLQNYGIFYFWILFNETSGTSADGHEKIIT